MTGPEDPAAAGRDRLRAGHADREQVIGMLKDAFVQGRLTRDELDTRAGRALAARTCADLAALTADIPAADIRGRPGRSRAAVPARPGAPPAAGQGGRRVGRLPDHRGRRHVGSPPPRSRGPPHSLWLGCQAAVPGLSRRRRRGARHLGVRGGRLMGAQALPQAAAARAGARRPRPRRRTTRRHRPGSGSPRPPHRPDRRRPAGSQVTAASAAPSRPGVPWRAAGARRGLTPVKSAPAARLRAAEGVSPPRGAGGGSGPRSGPSGRGPAGRPGLPRRSPGRR